MEKEELHIGIVCPDNFPDIILDEIINEIDEPQLKIAVKKTSPGAFAAAEWTIPTILITYLLKPYFEEFLKEAGKDHYQKLSNWLKKFVTNTKDISVKTITSSGSVHKLDDSYTQSKAISLIIQTKTGKPIKLLFDNDLSKEDWENAIDSILDFVINNYENFPNDEISIKTKDLKPNKPVYVLINKSYKELEFFDDSTIYMYMNKNNNT
ncbi:MAG: hypothetical protein ACO1OQ_03155 [Rufibacter sp.]